jgi:hypothetical protein
VISASEINSNDWMPVICNRLKENGHCCCSWIGAVDKTRVGRSIHYCPYCKINYLYTVCEDGRIEFDVIDGVIDSFDIPVTVGPADVYRKPDTEKR